MHLTQINPKSAAGTLVLLHGRMEPRAATGNRANVVPPPGDRVTYPC